MKINKFLGAGILYCIDKNQNAIRDDKSFHMVERMKSYSNKQKVIPRRKLKSSPKVSPTSKEIKKQENLKSISTEAILKKSSLEKNENENNEFQKNIFDKEKDALMDPNIQPTK